MRTLTIHRHDFGPLTVVTIHDLLSILGRLNQVTTITEGTHIRFSNVTDDEFDRVVAWAKRQDMIMILTENDHGEIRRGMFNKDGGVWRPLDSEPQPLG